MQKSKTEFNDKEHKAKPTQEQKSENERKNSTKRENVISKGSSHSEGKKKVKENSNLW